MAPPSLFSQSAARPKNRDIVSVIRNPRSIQNTQLASCIEPPVSLSHYFWQHCGILRRHHHHYFGLHCSARSVASSVNIVGLDCCLCTPVPAQQCGMPTAVMVDQFWWVSPISTGQVKFVLWLFVCC
ncbi:uncharacterized protein LOC131237246 [Magnolia sinica]|uniref:uncharacterized protein LOC131237246 n=1 Tax=Magnolia sinica TaxID=86752 RepID=UPI00265B0BB2|nr:uncharacterized protein LOC131237246 [Magnolia sinica]